jgi:presenilin-like A22 family membrane protease
MSVAAGICAIWMISMFMTLSVVGLIVLAIDWVVAVYNRPNNEKE